MNKIKIVVYVILVSALFVTLVRESEGAAFTPYVEAGVYKMMQSTSDRRLTDDGNLGSTTPGVLGAGIKIEGCRFVCGYADSVYLGWFHQSYLNRGGFLWKDYGGAETFWDGLGVRFEWQVKSLSWEW